MDVLQAVINALITIAVLVPIVIFLGNKFMAKGFEVASELLSGVFEKPAVAKAMGVLGKHSGEARRNRALENKIAGAAIDKLAGPYKMLADKVLGINIDELIEEYGAVEVLQTLQQFAPMLQGAGIDVKGLMGIASPQGSNTQLP